MLTSTSPQFKCVALGADETSVTSLTLPALVQVTCNVCATAMTQGVYSTCYEGRSMHVLLDLHTQLDWYHIRES